MDKNQQFFVGAWLAELSDICPDTLASWRTARDTYLRVRISAMPDDMCMRVHRAWMAMSALHASLRSAFHAARAQQSAA